MTQFAIPDACPVCGSSLSEEGDFLYCRSKACPAQIRGAVLVWTRNLGLLHWGDALLDNLVKSDPPMIQNLADLYRLTVDDIAECCSGLKMAEKCHQTLHANKSITVDLLFGSMNISNFALSTATDIVQAGFDTPDKILSMSQDQLESVPNIGKRTAQLIYDGLREKEQSIRDLVSVLDVKPPSAGHLTGKSFCITGELSAPRKSIELKILNAGGIVKSSVGKTTSFLVTNDATTGTSKLQNAKKYGVAVINEATLMKILDVT